MAYADNYDMYTKGNGQQNHPNIFSYLDYRKFLKDLYTYKKLKSQGFSHRHFSKLAGFRSVNYLKLVMDGKRNLSPEGAYKFAHALRLAETEKQFFLQLVLFNQSRNTEEQRHHYEQILQTGEFQKAKPLEPHQYAYFSKWYLIALRELAALKDFKDDPKWVNKKLGLNLSDEEIRDSFETLIRLGLIQRGENGKYVQVDAKIATAPEVQNLAVIHYHQQMIQKAYQAVDKTRAVHRDISALTVCLGEAEFNQIKKEINHFRARVHQIASQSKSLDAVYQVNFQLFNLSEVPWK